MHTYITKFEIQCTIQNYYRLDALSSLVICTMLLFGPVSPEQSTHPKRAFHREGQAYKHGEPIKRHSQLSFNKGRLLRMCEGVKLEGIKGLTKYLCVCIRKTKHETMD